VANLTEQESEILDLLTEIWNKYTELPDLHPSETTELQFFVHGMQRMIGARPTWRSIAATANSLSAINVNANTRAV
jgi:hypothetical protein